MRLFILKTAAASVAFILSAALPSSAAQTPRPGALDQRVTSVVYQANNVVQVSATWGISTMILFDEDEQFETISLGDTESWQVAPAEKGNILFITPVARDVATNMNVVTSKRIYFLELEDHAPDDKREVFGIRFVYPDKIEDARLRQEAERRAAFPNIFGLDKNTVHSDYGFSGDPTLRPTMVFDDGKKTFFRFDGQVPAIYAVQSNTQETLRNFRKEGSYLVVDGIARQYTLRDGDQWTCVFRLDRPVLPKRQTRSGEGASWNTFNPHREGGSRR
ncbi:type IV secretion system protein VirB9 [Rhizobium sp. NFR07]|nr:type IV secretion system protein VirB9 [Rhizobium sp. NFR07]